MAVSNEQVANWLASNPNLSDAEIASAMAQYGVSASQMAAVTGIDAGVIQARVEAVAPTAVPTAAPTAAPTQAPTAKPTAAPAATTASRAQQYLNANPDVKAEYELFSAREPGKWTPESYAAYHYLNYGAKEGRTGGGFNDAADALAQQILGQGTAGQWSGEALGSKEATARDMAARLAAFGITDLNQFGVREKVIPASSTQDYDGYTTETPARTVQEYYNKTTGQAIEPYYDKATGNTWSGTFAGEGSTAYKVNFTPDGTPVFYTQYGGSSNDLANLIQDIGPVGQIGLALATGGLSIPQQIAAQMAVQILSGKDLGDAIKSAAISMAVAQIPGTDLIKEGASYLNGIDPTGVLTKSFQTAATSATRAVLTGADISNALLSGAVSGGISGAVDLMAKGVDGFDKLSKAEQSAVKTAITGVISGKPLDQALVNAAIAAANTTAKQASIPKDAVKQLTDAGLTEDLRPDQAYAIQYDTAIESGKTPAQAAEFAKNKLYSIYGEDQTLAMLPLLAVPLSTQVAGAAGSVAVNSAMAWLLSLGTQNELPAPNEDTKKMAKAVLTYIVANPTASTADLQMFDPNLTKEQADYLKENAKNIADYGEITVAGKKMTPEEKAEFDRLNPTEAPTEEPTQPPTSAPTSAPTQAPTQPPTAAPTANITPKQVEQIVNDAIKSNPNLTKEDVQKIVSDAVLTVPNLTADQVKNIVSTEVAKAPEGVSATDVQKTVDAAKTDLTKAIEKVSQGAASGAADLQKSIDALKAAGLTAADVQKVVDASAANQSNATKQAIADATKGLASSAALEKVQSDLGKEIQAAKDVGLQGDAALQAGLNSLSAKMGLNQAEVLKQLGTTEAALKNQFASEISGVKTDLAQTEKDILAEVAKNEAAGMTRDAALQKAINTVAATQKKDAASLLAGLGKTEATLRSEMESGFAGVNEQYNTLSTAQKAAADALVAQGKTLQDAITQAKSETTGQIAGVESRLTDAIKAAEAMGLSRDQAITAAVDSVAAELGTTKTGLLSQIGKTETALRNEFATGISGLEAQTKAQYDSLNAAQKATADALVTQGKTLQDAIAAAQAQTTGQIAGVSADVQAKYAALTAAQKAEADARVAQGQDLQSAIAGVSSQVAGVSQQVAGLEGQLTAQGKAFADQLTQQGMDYETALQTAIDAQSALIGGQIGDVKSQVAANEAARQADVKAGKVASVLSQGQQQLQNIQQQLPQAYQMAQTTSTPIYGEMGPYLDIGSDLDFGFFKPSPEKQAATKQAQTTKIAAGGYLDDLIADRDGMSTDDLVAFLLNNTR